MPPIREGDAHACHTHSARPALCRSDRVRQRARRLRRRHHRECRDHPPRDRARRQDAYTATAGHLVTVDPSSSKPTAKIFYVAFTADPANAQNRPVTFFYNGGPGSSSVYIMLGSFAPTRLK